MWWFIFGNPPTGSGFAGFPKEANAKKEPENSVSLTWHQEPRKTLIWTSLYFLFLWLVLSLILAIKKIIIKQSGRAKTCSKPEKSVFMSSSCALESLSCCSPSLTCIAFSILRLEINTVEYRGVMARREGDYWCQNVIRRSIECSSSNCCVMREICKKWFSRWRCVKKV